MCRSQSTGENRGSHGVHVEIDHFQQRVLIAPSENPSHGNATALQSLEHLGVSLGHLLGREKTTERIIDVRIGTGLVKHDLIRHEPQPFAGGLRGT